MQVNPLRGVLLDLGLVLHRAVVVIRPPARLHLTADGGARPVTQGAHLVQATEPRRHTLGERQVKETREQSEGRRFGESWQQPLTSLFPLLISFFTSSMENPPMLSLSEWDVTRAEEKSCRANGWRKSVCTSHTDKRSRILFLWLIITSAADAGSVHISYQS